MKTIEEKLSDYLDSKSSDSLGSPINALSVGFRDGYNEALRWRDPEKELPELGVDVFVKVEQSSSSDPGNAVIVYTSSFRMEDCYHSEKKNPFACEGYRKGEYTTTTNKVIGWRPIE